jgi:hypothetical protein
LKSLASEASQWRSIVMAGLVPVIPAFLASRLQDVDARHKAGHDEGIGI